MNFKTLAAVAVGASFVAISAGVVNAKPVPADQFHWSSAIENNSFKYDGKTYNLAGKLNAEAEAFIANCPAQQVRIRGFLDAKGKEDYTNAELLCGRLSIGGDTPVSYREGGEVKVFGPIYMTDRNNVLPECQPYTGATTRVWSNCGVLVPNDQTAMVLVGAGGNAGKQLETARYGSGVATVKPILVPEVEAMRERIFQERLAKGYYK